MDDDQMVKMRISVGMLRTLITRDDYGNRLRLELKGPDDEGFFLGVVTTDFEDNAFTDPTRTSTQTGP